MSKGWAGGSTRHWRRTRAAVIIRDAALGYTCRAHQDGWCDRSGAKPHTCARQLQDAHHTHGRAITGDDPRYIVGSCHPCNLAIGEPGGDPLPRPMTRW